MHNLYKDLYEYMITKTEGLSAETSPCEFGSWFVSKRTGKMIWLQVTVKDRPIISDCGSVECWEAEE